MKKMPQRVAKLQTLAVLAIVPLVHYHLEFVFAANAGSKTIAQICKAALADLCFRLLCDDAWCCV